MDSFVAAGLPAWLALVGVSTTLLYIYLTWTFRTFGALGLKGPRPWLVFGNMLPLLRKSVGELDIERSKLYGKVYGVFEGRTPVLIVGDPDVAKEILIKEFHCFANRSPFKILQEKPLDRILHVIRDDHWKHVRTSLSPVYSSGKLKQMLPTINDCADKLMAYLSKKSDSEVDVKDMLAGYTLDIIAGTAFGLDTRALEEPDSMFMRSSKEVFSRTGPGNIRKMLTIFVNLASPKLGLLLQKLGISIFDRSAVTYLEHVVRHLLANTGDVAKQTFVHLCQDQLVNIEQITSDEVRRTVDGTIWTTKGLTADDIVANSFLFLVAGYDTVSTFLTLFCYAMATNPDAQQKAYQEISESSQQNGCVDYDKLKGLHYIDMCMDETLRLYPPLLRLDRMCNTTTTVAGICIPEGMKINIAVYNLHHDPDYWEDPYTFKPERFLPAAKAEIHPCIYLPFGAGPRNCIGMRLALLEAKTLIVKLLSTYTICMCKSTPMPPLKLGKTFRLLSPAEPIRLSFRKRQLS